MGTKLIMKNKISFILDDYRGHNISYLNYLTQSYKFKYTVYFPSNKLIQNNLKRFDFKNKKKIKFKSIKVNNFFFFKKYSFLKKVLKIENKKSSIFFLYSENFFKELLFIFFFYSPIKVGGIIDRIYGNGKKSFKLILRNFIWKFIISQGFVPFLFKINNNYNKNKNFLEKLIHINSLNILNIPFNFNYIKKRKNKSIRILIFGSIDKENL